jgi:hypothetical protein
MMPQTFVADLSAMGMLTVLSLVTASVQQPPILWPPGELCAMLIEIVNAWVFSLVMVSLILWLGLDFCSSTWTCWLDAPFLCSCFCCETSTFHASASKSTANTIIMCRNMNTTQHKAQIQTHLRVFY